MTRTSCQPGTVSRLSCWPAAAQGGQKRAALLAPACGRGTGNPPSCTIVGDTKAQYPEVTLGCPGPGSGLLTLWGVGCWDRGYQGASWLRGSAECRPPHPPPVPGAGTEASESELPLLPLGALGGPGCQERFPGCPQACWLGWRTVSWRGWGQSRGQRDDPGTDPHPEPQRQKSPLWDADRGWGGLLGRQPEAPRLHAKPEALRPNPVPPLWEQQTTAGLAAILNPACPHPGP